MFSHFLPLIPYPYRGEHVACPVCGCTDSEPIGRMDRRLKPLQTALCKGCGLMYTNPMPTEEEVNRYYRNTYRFDYQLALFRPPSRHIKRKKLEAMHRYQQLASVRDLSERLCTLDFGCGSGEIAHYFASKCHHAHGFDPSRAYASYGAEQGLAEIRVGNWSEMTYASESFDVITSLHVIEHLRQPVLALRRIAEWLKPDGIAHVEVPDMQSAALKLKGFEQFHFAHLVGFSQDNLILAGKLAGFGVFKRFGPTSIVFSKSSAVPEINLTATVEQNRNDYNEAVSFSCYIKHHAQRIYWLATR